MEHSRLCILGTELHLCTALSHTPNNYTKGFNVPHVRCRPRIYTPDSSNTSTCDRTQRASMPTYHKGSKKFKKAIEDLKRLWSRSSDAFNRVIDDEVVSIDPGTEGCNLLPGG